MENFLNYSDDNVIKELTKIFYKNLFKIHFNQYKINQYQIKMHFDLILLN